VVATLEGADAISMSLGGFVPRNVRGDAAVVSAFNRVSNFATSHGAIVFAAAGNSALNLDRIRSFIELPGQASGVIPVIATTNPALFPRRAGAYPQEEAPSAGVHATQPGSSGVRAVPGYLGRSRRIRAPSRRLGRHPREPASAASAL